MQSNSEQVFQDLLSEGGDRAFTHIYNLYSRQLYFIIVRIAGNKETAEDIVAESYVKLHARLQSGGQLTQLRSFLFKTAQNACLDWLRAQKRHALSHAEIKYLAREGEEGVERALLHAEVLQCLYAGIRKLPQKYAEIINRSYIQGESLTEIAAAMDLSYKTIQNLKAKAVQELRRLMAEDDMLRVAVLLLICLEK